MRPATEKHSTPAVAMLAHGHATPASNGGRSVLLGEKMPVDLKKKLSLIDSFIDAGYALIPLCSVTIAHNHNGRPCKTQGKVPVPAGWQHAKLGDFSVEELRGGNYGVVLGEETLVIDVDPRNFKPGDKPVTRLCKDLGINLSALNTLIVQTGGKGLHFYLSIPAGLSIVNDLKEYPGIEFKSKGRQVVGPGSVTNHPYNVLSGRIDALAACPQILIDAITKKEKVLPANAGTSDFKRDEGSRRRFAEYLKNEAEPSVEGNSGDLNAVKVAMRGRDLGLAPDMTAELMLEHWNPRCTPEWTPDDLAVKIRNAYAYAKNPVGVDHPAAAFTVLPKPTIREEDIPWDYTAQGGLRKNFKNLVNFLRSPIHGLAGIFGYNEFTGTVEIINPAPWHDGKMPIHKAVSDHDLKMLKGHLAFRCGFEAVIGNLEEAVVIVANGNRFHPVREYLTSLKWDGVARLDHWLRDYAGAADDAYTRACSRKTLCAAVMRAFKPGCKFDHVLVLEGGQDIGKSTMTQVLGGAWSGDFSVDPRDKDTIQLMQGHWIIELAELADTRNADVEAFKAFITRTIDTARLAYGRLAQSYPRQSIFIASKNPRADGAYLKDDTGNRRWWPVAINPPGGFIDIKGLKEARNLLFAEAVHYAKKGERLDMDTAELKAAAKAIVALRHADHEWTERIASWVITLPPERDFLTSRDVFLDAMGGLDKQITRRAEIAIAGIMRNVGWKPGTKWIDGRASRGYIRAHALPVILA